MFFSYKNFVRHILVILLSFSLLLPCVWMINKSYYTSIFMVNFWEEKEIISLLTFILKNTEPNKINNDLLVALNEIKFFDIKIFRNTSLVLHKPLEKYEIDLKSARAHEVENYKVLISKRAYHSFYYDYKRYINTLFTHPSKLVVHQILVIFVVHLNLILLLEIALLNISIKYRLKKLSESISTNN